MAFIFARIDQETFPADTVVDIAVIDSANVVVVLASGNAGTSGDLGTAWNFITGPLGNIDSPTQVLSNGTNCVTIGDASGSTGLSVSTDQGNTWTDVTPGGAVLQPILNYSPTAGRFFVFDQTSALVWSSADGVTWSSHATPHVFTQNIGIQSAAACADSGSEVVVIGFDSPGITAATWRSVDAQTWVTEHTVATTGMFDQGNVVWDGSQFIATWTVDLPVSTQQVLTSPTGVTWTVKSSSTAAGTAPYQPQVVSFAGDIFNGFNGGVGSGLVDVAQSTDSGVSWLPISVSFTGFVSALLAADNTAGFIYEYGSGVLSSPDGTTWSIELDAFLAGGIIKSFQVAAAATYAVGQADDIAGGIWMRLPEDLVLTGAAVSDTENDIAWTDSSGLASQYGVFRDGTQIATTGNTQFTFNDNGLTGSTTYTYQVVAIGMGFNPPAAASNYLPLTTQPPPSDVTVPDVTGEDLATATADLTGVGLVVGTVTDQSSDTVPAGDIIDQSPVGGDVVPTGTAVDMDISVGPAPNNIPDVTNTSLEIADEILAAAGFVVGVVTFAPSVLIIPGNVVSQSPVGGTPGNPGDAVDLVISTGRPSLLVPDLIGLTQPEAVALLLSLGLVPGAQSIAPSQFVESGFVMAQNPTAGLPVASGFIVSFIISSGPALVSTAFDFETTVISQYANSPTILQLAKNMNAYIDQTANFENFYNFVWNVDTAVGFGLDIWGKIVDVSRLLQIPNTTLYVGFDNSATPPPDWQTMGSDQDNPAVGGAMYTGHNATQTYLLPDDAYRQLILAKAFANIAATTAPAINQILQNLYGVGNAWVLNDGPMAISYNLNFTPTAIQLAILEQSGVIPTPPGVAVTINTNV